MTGDESDRGKPPGPTGGSVERRHLTPDPGAAEYELLEVVAELERTDIDDLPPLYVRVDRLVKSVFQRPPAPETRVVLTFNYAGYRITLQQSGEVELVANESR